MQILLKVFDNYRQILLYLFFGICTTLINVALYWALAYGMHWGVGLSTAAAWVGAVSFAFVTNRNYVFEGSERSWVQELFSFFLMRALTGLLDLGIMILFVEQLGFNDLIMKVLSNGLVIVLNFILSKLVVFRKKVSA